MGLNNTFFQSIKIIAMASLVTLSSHALSDSLNPLIDDFNDANNNNLGIPRMSISDTTAGGKTTTEISVQKGVIKIKGDIVPPRGQPGWSSLVLPLGAPDAPKNASKFKGLKLLVKVNSGNLSISANSTEVTNFDYHAAQIAVSADGKFHEVKVPFDSMKRTWSAQTKLNTKTLNSFSIVAFGMQKTSYDFEIEEVTLY